MEAFNTYIREEIKKLFDPHSFVIFYIEQFLKVHKIELNKLQTDQLVSQNANDSLSISLTLNDDQIRESNFSSEDLFEIEFSLYMKQFYEKADIFLNKLEIKLPNILINAMEEYSKKVVKSLYRTTDDMMADRERIQKQVKSDIKKKYKEELKIFQMIVEIISEVFISINTRADKNNKKEEVLVRIIGESCLVAKEIYTLLINGFPDGAFARWRNLYEQSVIALFISNKEESLAEKYMDHLYIDNYKSMLIYNQKAERLNQEQISTEEINNITHIYNELLKRYGKEFKQDYGWALSEFRKSKIIFRDLEEAVGIDHLRPYYKLSCSRVHTSSKGMKYKLGFPQGQQGTILFGPSTVGFEDPIQLTIMCLIDVICAEMIQKNDYDKLIIVNIINELNEDLRQLLEKNAT